MTNIFEATMPRGPNGEKDVNDYAKSGKTEIVTEAYNNATPVTGEPPKKKGAFWQRTLQTNKEGKAINNLANAITALSAAPELKGVVALDAFANRNTLTRMPPWQSEPVPRPWTDADDIALQNWLQCHGVPIASLMTVTNAVQVVAKREQYDPLMDFLKSLKWDGKERLSTWCAHYLGADDTPLTAEVGRRFMVSAVARALQPGCKADHVLVLEGAQGLGKSQAVAILGGDWTQDDTPDLHSKDAAMSLAGRWFIELSELSAMNKSEVEHVKRFLTLRSDKYRPPYGRNYIEQPRRCVFVATTNEHHYLRDHTGNRRFWPVACTRIATDALAADREQLLAEAVVAYQAGEQWHITDQSLVAAAESEQWARVEVDPWQGIIAREIEFRTSVTNRALLDILDIPPERQSGGYAKRVGNIMRALGWQQIVDKSGGVRDVVWFPRQVKEADLPPNPYKLASHAKGT